MAIQFLQWLKRRVGGGHRFPTDLSRVYTKKGHVMNVMKVQRFTIAFTRLLVINNERFS